MATIIKTNNKPNLINTDRRWMLPFLFFTVCNVAIGVWIKSEINAINRSMDDRIEAQIDTSGERLFRSIQEYQKTANLAALARQADAATPVLAKLENDFKLVTLGSTDQDSIKLYYAFDFSCQFCKRQVPELYRILDSNKKFKIVLVPYPVLDSLKTGSREAAINFLAAISAGANPDAMFKLFTADHPGQFDRKTLEQIMAQTGVAEKITTDQKTNAAALVDASLVALSSLQVRGTPWMFALDPKSKSGEGAVQGKVWSGYTPAATILSFKHRSVAAAPL